MPDGQYPSPRFLIATLDRDPVNPHDDTRRGYVDGLISGLSATFVLRSQAGVAGGYATLDSTIHIPMSQLLAGVVDGLATLGGDGLVPTAQLPVAATGGMNYQGQWNPVTNTTPALATGGLFNGSATTRGDYVVATVTGTSTAIDGITSWSVGDWAVSTGSAWQKQANSTGFGTMAPQNANAVAITGGSTAGQTQIGVSTGDLIFGVSSGPVNIAYTDRFGFIGAMWNRDGTWTFPAGITASPYTSSTMEATTSVTTPAVVFSSNLSTVVANIPGRALVIVDPFFLSAFSVANDGSLVTSTALPSSYSASEIASRANANLALSMSVKGQVNTTAARPTWKYNHIVWYGQSEAVSFAGTPAITLTQPYDNLMLGASLRPNPRAGTNFIPVTDANLHPLIATNQDTTGAPITIKTGTLKGVHGCTFSVGGLISTTDTVDFTILFAAGDEFQMEGWVSANNNNDTNYTIASVTPTTIQVNESYQSVVTVPQDGINFFCVTNTAHGESMTVAGMNLWRRQQLAFRGLSADPSRIMVATDCGYVATSIAGLSKGASPEDFNRMRAACTQVRAAAIAAGGDYGIPVITFHQGGTDTLISTTAAAYKAAFSQLWTDMVADLATTIAGQTVPPFYFFYQIGGGNSLDDGTIAQAQLDLALNPSSPNWYCLGPYYGITDWTVHPDSNGYRWWGSQVGKILHRVVDLGNGWKPLYCTAATYRGRQILLDFHVPEPPLQVQPFYRGFKATTFTDLGFTVTDSSGAVTVNGAQLVSSTGVMLTVGRDFTSAPTIQYGSNSGHQGSGNVCDSDPTVAEAVYTYVEGSGQSPSANVAALVGKPYPLWNWLCLFTMTAVAG